MKDLNVFDEAVRVFEKEGVSTKELEKALTGAAKEAKNFGLSLEDLMIMKRVK